MENHWNVKKKSKMDTRAHFQNKTGNKRMYKAGIITNMLAMTD